MSTGTSPILYFLVPLFNEAKNVLRLIESLQDTGNTFGKYVLVFVDDGSTDGTRDILANCRSAGDFVILGSADNRGPGAAFLMGFNWLIDNADEDAYVVTLEGDNTADLTTLPDILELLRQNDLVLASVYTTGGSFSDTSWWRLLISKIANTTTRLLLGIKQQTLTSFYRGWRLDFIRKMNQRYRPLIRETGYICQVELLHKASRENARISEIPTRLYSERRIGKSKMKVIRTMVQHGAFILRTLWGR